jgi:hypothetical protein
LIVAQHGLLVSQILAHIDYLYVTIAILSERIEEPIAVRNKKSITLLRRPGCTR